jgi:hypothetical protein
MIYATNLRVETNARGEEMARATIHVEAWDGWFDFQVGVRNEGPRDHVLEELRVRLRLLFESVGRELAQGALSFRENPAPH